MPSYRRLLLLEDLSKGLFLGLCHTLVVRVTTPSSLLWVVAIVASVLGMGLSLENRRQKRGKPKGRAPLLITAILGILDHPAAVSLWLAVGLVMGLLAGPGIGLANLFAIGFGLLAGLALHVLKRLSALWLRRTAAVAWVAGLAALAWFGQVSGWTSVEGSPGVVSMALVLSGLGYHLLAFAGRDEETELEIAIPCVALSLALGTLDLPPMARGAVVLLPLGLFVVYCERIRKHLVVFKHVLRGMGHEQQGNLRDGLWYYRQALAADPNAELAIAGNWRVHKLIDPRDLAGDPDLMQMIDPLVCLSRAGELLSAPTVPPTALEEADKLLGIVEYRRPDLPWTIGWHRLRLLLAEGKGEEALSWFQKHIDVAPRDVMSFPSHEADSLFQIWQLGLKDQRLIGRGSLDVLETPRRLFDLLAVVGRRLIEIPDDADAQQLRPFLYDKLALDRFEAYVSDYPNDPMDWFDFRYCWELARGASGDGALPGRVIELLRIAEHGLPAHRLVIWHTIGRLSESTSPEQAHMWHARVKELGLSLGQSQLSGTESDAFFASVRYLADRALSANRIEEAIDHLEIYTRSAKSGLETLRVLKELYEASGQPVLALRPVEAALAYSLGERQQKEWAAEKARLYRLLRPEEVRARLGEVERYFDFGYCYRRAKSLFDSGGDAEVVMHDLELASLGGRSYLIPVNYLLGRCHWQKGEVDNAVLCWEAVRQSRPERFADKDQEEAFFQSTRFLGDAYLETLNQPEKAIECFSIYKDYVKSGADTLYKLAAAYERSGQPAHARKWYDMVLVYPSHPKAGPAREALARLQAIK